MIEGVYVYPDYKPTLRFFRNKIAYSKPVTLKQGQVLLAGTFVESIVSGVDKGKVVAHSGLSESAIVSFSDITSGQTVVIAGLTWTAGASGTTAAELAEAWEGIGAGTAFGDLSDRTAGGSFTSGTLTGYSSYGYSGSEAVVFTSTSALTDVTDLAVTGTGGSAQDISVSDGATSFAPIAGVLLFDVDASDRDVDCPVYTEASFWAEALKWVADPATEFMTKEDGSTVPVSAYNTGAFGSTFDETKRLQTQFVEGSGFENLGFLQEGEKHNG